ncbi:MAG: polyketide cyclase / dehydrase and lipid transport family protein [Betaproteobacteria bacterium]|nr:polyketide cyclase / dehydrase and lipid transport family protein [Betaproteobacteria bacterium]
MLKIALIVLILLVLAVVVVLVIAMQKPDTFSVQRAILIKAPPEKIFPYINDLKAWTTWSPYEKKDPAMQRTLSAVTAGKGAVYEWNGNKNVGQGRMEILDAPAPSKVVIKLDFLKPFEGHNTAEFTLVPQGDASQPTTQVTWLMHGPAPLMNKVMSTVMNLDKMIGDDFADGLANLKALAEK